MDWIAKFLFALVVVVVVTKSTHFKSDDDSITELDLQTLSDDTTNWLTASAFGQYEMWMSEQEILFLKVEYQSYGQSSLDILLRSNYREALGKIQIAILTNVQSWPAVSFDVIMVREGLGDHVEKYTFSGSSIERNGNISLENIGISRYQTWNYALGDPMYDPGNVLIAAKDFLVFIAVDTFNLVSYNNFTTEIEKSFPDYRFEATAAQIIVAAGTPLDLFVSRYGSVDGIKRSDVLYFDKSMVSRADFEFPTILSTKLQTMFTQYESTGLTVPYLYWTENDVGTQNGVQYRWTLSSNQLDYLTVDFGSDERWTDSNALNSISHAALLTTYSSSKGGYYARVFFYYCGLEECFEEGPKKFFSGRQIPQVSLPHDYGTGGNIAVIGAHDSDGSAILSLVQFPDGPSPVNRVRRDVSRSLGLPPTCEDDGCGPTSKCPNYGQVCCQYEHTLLCCIVYPHG